MKRLIIYLLSSLYIFPCFAEDNLTPWAQREILLRSMEILDNYEMSMLASDYDAEQNFIDLFESDSMLIYNDLLGMSPKREILLQDYVSLLQNQVQNPIFILKNVRRSEIVDNGNSYELTLYFDKSLNYSNACGVLLSSQEYFGKDHNMVMKIIFDKENLDGKVRSLTGSIDSRKAWLGDDFAVLNYTSPYDKRVRCNGKLIEFNSFEQAIIPRRHKFTYSDPDMKFWVVRDNKDCNMYSLRYIPKRWNLTPYLDMALGGPYKMESDVSNLDVSSSMMEFGAEVSYTFPSESNYKLSLSTGLAYAKSSMDLKLNGSLDYHYHASENADIDGEAYDRYYSISEVSQTVDMSHVMIPIGVRMDMRFGSIFSAYAKVGLKNYLKMKAETTQNKGSQHVYGIYYGYGEPIIFDQPEFWGYNNFGESTWGIENLQSAELNASSFTTDAFLGLGCNLKVYGPISVTAGLKYQFGLLGVVKTENELLNLNNESPNMTENNALVIYDVDKGEQVRSLTEATKSIKRNGLFLNFGVSIKF